MDILQRIRRAVREQKYRISSHANEEMSEDDLEAKDIECNVLAVEWHGGSRRTRAAPAMKLSGRRGLPLSSVRGVADHHNLCRRRIKRPTVASFVTAK